jgi:hypothetical protein
MSGEDHASKLSALSPVKRALLEQRLRGPSSPTTRTQPRITRRSDREHAPLSFDQQAILSLLRAHDVPSAYQGIALLIHGPLDIQILRRSVDEVIRRHESLRTTFATLDAQPVQVIGSPRPFDVPVLDLSDLPEAERQPRAQQLAAAELERRFDLAGGPLLRAVVISLTRAEFVLVLVIDHLVADFLSMGIFIQELGTIYDAFAHGRPSPLPELPVQFGDWTEWQRRLVAGGELAAQFTYWQTRLRGCSSILELPFARPRPATRTFKGATKSLNLSTVTADALKALSQRQSVSLYTTLLAAFAVLVSDYTRRDDFVLGRGIPGRTSSETENLIGCFVNLLPLRLDTSGGPTFQELLRRVSETVNTAYANQDVPFVKLVEVLQVETPVAYPPLVQVVFNLYTPPELQPLSAAAVRPFDLGAQKPTDDVALFHDVIVGIKDSGRGLTAEARFNQALFAAEAVGDMLVDYERLLSAAVTRPELCLPDLLQTARG